MKGSIKRDSYLSTASDKAFLRIEVIYLHLYTSSCVCFFYYHYFLFIFICSGSSLLCMGLL